MKAYALGLDFGTASVRALLVRLADGAEVGRGVCPYAHGEGGVILDPAEPRLARQHPQDYLEGMQVAVREALAEAQRTEAEFAPEKVVGIGVSTTGSSPLAVDAGGEPLSEDPAALVWLWKDHTATPEAAEITRLARQERPHYIAKYGGTYSSEWYWAKLLRLVRQAPQIAQAAADWVEIQDWIPAVLTGKTDLIPRGICAAGHKAYGVQRPSGLSPQPRPVDEAQAAGKAIHEEVLADGEVGEEVELLVDEPHPARAGLTGGARGVAFPGQPHLPAVRRHHTPHDVHQGGLARAVCPYQPQHLPPLEGQVHLLQHRNAEEGLAYAAELQKGHPSLPSASSARAARPALPPRGSPLL